MNRAWAARIAAPVAFLAGVTLAVLLVRSGLSDEAATTAPTRSLTTIVETPGRTQAPPRERVFATVEEGDTLDEIAAEHDTSVERLLELNPDLDPTNLQIGQRVRVR